MQISTAHFASQEFLSGPPIIHVQKKKLLFVGPYSATDQFYQ